MNPNSNQYARYPLGTTELKFSPIGLGTWQFSQGKGMIGKFWPTLSNTSIHDIVHTALDSGINWFDTAQAYGGGQSERALSDALNALKISPPEAFIATKWWPVLRSSRSLEATITHRLQQLRGWPITLYQIHQPYSRSTIALQMKSMAILLDQGFIQCAGVSNFSAAQMTEAYKALRAHGHSLVSNQVRYNLLDRRVENNDILLAAEDLGITIIAYSPLAQGILTGKFHGGLAKPRGFRKWDPRFRTAQLDQSAHIIRLLQTLGEKYQVGPAEVALNWLIGHPSQRVMAIPGATSTTQALQNAHAMQWTLSSSDRSALDHTSVSA
ncbi:MAG: aldo/keto reductase [Sulfobacillus sp.]